MSELKKSALKFYKNSMELEKVKSQKLYHFKKSFSAGNIVVKSVLKEIHSF